MAVVNVYASEVANQKWSAWSGESANMAMLISQARPHTPHSIGRWVPTRRRSVSATSSSLGRELVLGLVAKGLNMLWHLLTGRGGEGTKSTKQYLCKQMIFIM